MANKMVANIKSLTTETRGLTKEVESLYKSIEKLNAIAGKAFTNVSAAINTSGGSMGLGQGTTRTGTGTDNARFTQPPAPTGMSNAGGGNPVSKSRTQFAQEGPVDPTVTKLDAMKKVFSGTAKILMAAPAGAYAATPDVGLTMSRALGYYQAGLTVPGISRNQLQRATFGAMGGGLSSVGSDAIVAAGLAGRGYTPGSENYKQAAAQIGGAYKYLGMDNAVATQAIAGFQTGPMGANLYQYGITTRDASGKEKTPGQLAKELMGVMGGGKATTQQVRESYQRGALGANLKTMGFDPAQQEILYQAMIDISAGRNPDLAKRGSEQGTDKNSNTMLTAQGRMNASQTTLMTKGEESMIKGFENAADTVEAFNRALENVIQPLSQLKGLVGGVNATNVGPGLATTASLLASGVSDLFSVTKILKGIATKGKGGGATGYGAGFGTSGTKSSSPVAAGITAGYGEKGDVWSGTNGTHKGTDYAVPVGTPVTSWKDGVVSKEILDPGYGTAVMIDHADGHQSIYAHLSSKTVNAGDTVKAGQRIGKSGDTGNVTGPHLHFEIRKGKNNPVDTAGYTNASSLLGGQYISGSLAPSTGELLKTGDASNTSTVSKSVSTSVSGTGSQAEFATGLLTRLGAPLTEGNVKALTTWMRFEGGHWKNSAKYNPLNTTLKVPGATSMNSVGVKAYANWDEGLQATISTLTGSKADARGYTAIVNALKSGTDPNAVLDAVNNSAWLSGKTGKPGYKFPTIKGGGDVGYGASMPTQPQPATSQPSFGYESSTPTQSQLGNKTVNVTIKFDQATDQNAIRFAKKVKEYLDHDKEISMIGGS
jgi:murein DD-endopeptidase MepM/ murein hydrolase activator NlpD